MKPFPISWRHFLAEIGCTLFGHSEEDLMGYAPIEVWYHYHNGTCAKVADNICKDCGHFINHKRIDVKSEEDRK